MRKVPDTYTINENAIVIIKYLLKYFRLGRKIQSIRIKGDLSKSS